MKALPDECLPCKLKYDLRGVRDNDYRSLAKDYEVDDNPVGPALALLRIGWGQPSYQSKLPLILANSQV